MERRLFANSLGAILLGVLVSFSHAQDFKPRESSDPYFKADGNATQSTGPRVAENTLQPRMPNMERPGTRVQPLQPRQARPLSSDFKIQPRQPSTSGGNNNNDFRPRASGQPSSSPMQGTPSGQRMSNQNVAANQNQFSANANSFRPQTGSGSFAPGSIDQSQPLQRNQLMPQQQNQQNGSSNFNSSNDFQIRSGQATEPNRVPLPGEQRPLTSPPRNSQPNPRSRPDFVNVSPMQTEMRTSIDTAQTQDGDEFEPGRVVAIVGGKPIFVGDMLFDVNQALDRFMPGAPADVKKSQRGLVIKKMLPNFINSKLLLIDTLESLPEGASFDTIIDSAGNDFDEKVLPLLIEKSNVTSAIELDAKMRAQGGSLRQFRHRWSEEQIVKYFTGQKLKIDTEVSHQDMLEYYEQNRQQYHKKAKVRWEELSVRFDKVPNRNEAERMIKKMGNEVVYGAPFDAVAQRSSQGFTASEGGKHDWTSRGSLVYKDVENALFSIPVNELSDVIPSQDGLHIVRVIERTNESYTPFLEAQVEIKQQLEAQKREMAFAEHLKKLRDRIPFEIQLDDVELPAHLAGRESNLK